VTTAPRLDAAHLACRWLTGFRDAGAAGPILRLSLKSRLETRARTTRSRNVTCGPVPQEPPSAAARKILLAIHTRPRRRHVAATMSQLTLLGAHARSSKRSTTDGTGLSRLCLIATPSHRVPVSYPIHRSRRAGPPPGRHRVVRPVLWRLRGVGWGCSSSPHPSRRQWHVARRRLGWCPPVDTEGRLVPRLTIRPSLLTLAVARP
jgi:hypothetical protein